MSAERARDFMALVAARLADPTVTAALPDLTVRMTVDELGSWLLTVRERVGSAAFEPVGGGARAPAACECASSLDALERMASGRLKPALAALSGQIRLTGDRRVFVHLREILGDAAAAATAAARAAAAASPALRVEVGRVVVVSDGLGRYASYELLVREAGHSWRLRLRWSDVRRLALDLARDGRRNGAARAATTSAAPAPAPALARWGADLRRSLHPAFLERRRARIQAYLSALLAQRPVSVLKSSGPRPLVQLLKPLGADALALAQAAGAPASARAPLAPAAAGADAAIELAELEAAIARAQARPIRWARDGYEGRAALHARLRALEQATGLGRRSAASAGALAALRRNPLGAVLGACHACLAATAALCALARADAAAGEPGARLLAWLAVAAVVAGLNNAACATVGGALVRMHASPLSTLLGAARLARELTRLPLSDATTTAATAAASCATAAALGDAQGEDAAYDGRSRELFTPPSLSELELASLFGWRAALAVRAAPLAAALICAALLALRALRRPLLRLWRIYSTAALTICAYELLRRALRALGTPAALEARAYAAVDALVAPFVCAQLGALRSLWVKFGQYIGSRADLVPASWAGALESLQDDLPADRAAHVRATVSAQLGHSIDDLFSEFEWLPLASASVAQVHRARLRASGQPVALKLQHEGIGPLLRGDFVAALRIAAFVARRDARYEPMLTVLRAWAREAEAELDFRNEAAHLRAVGANLRAAGVRALVPQPVHGLVGERAFAMDFVDGFKLTDRALLALHGVDRDALMARVTAAYACQLFTDGQFNADPHPGNLLVSLDAGRGGGAAGAAGGGGADLATEASVALLDFGWTVELPKARRLAYCALVAATAEMDAAAIASAMRSLGLASNQPDKPERDLAFWAHYLRDTGGRVEQRAEMDAFLETRKAERRADKAAGGETRRIVDVPDDFMFFLRTLGLLRGLATLLDAKVPYLELLCMYAKRALLREELGLPPARAA